MLFVDSREKANIKTLVTSTVGPSCSVQALACADFLLFDQDGHSLGMERKTASDLLGSLTHKNLNGNYRLDDQLDRMAVEYTHRMLIVEGWPSFNPATRKLSTGSRDTGWDHASLQMRMWSLLLSTGTNMLLTSDKYATADLLRYLHKKSEAGCVLPHTLREEIEEAA